MPTNPTDTPESLRAMARGLRPKKGHYSCNCDRMDAIVDALRRAADRLASPQCCMCGKLGLSTTEGDGGTECQLTDGRWTCSADCWERAVEPDPDALTVAYLAGAAEKPDALAAARRAGAEEVRAAAAEACVCRGAAFHASVANGMLPDDYRTGYDEALDHAFDAILALPLPGDPT